MVARERGKRESMPDKTLAAALAAITMWATPAIAQEPAAPAASRTAVLAIFAHPDDELVVAPALADAAGDGVDVVIVYATRGDAGPGVSSFEKGAALAAAREGEARCASRALGLGTPLFLDYGDGTLWEQAQDRTSGASALETELRALIAERRPATIITWGPDGGYGHADHRMIHALVTEIVQDAAPQTMLLYPGIPDGTLPPVPEMQRWATTAPALLTIEARYDEAELAKAAQAAGCHATQFDAETRAQLVPLFDQSIWRGAVRFREAFGRGD